MADPMPDQLDMLLQGVAALATLLMFWAYGHGWPRAPWCGLLSDACWWAMVLGTGAWPLLLVTAPATLLHLRDLLRWRRSPPWADLAPRIAGRVADQLERAARRALRNDNRAGAAALFIQAAEIRLAPPARWQP